MRNRRIKGILLLLGDVGIVIFSIYLSFVIRFPRKITFYDLNPVTLFLSSFVFVFYFYVFGAYDIDEIRLRKAGKSFIFIFLSCLTASLTNALIFYAIPSIRYGRGLFAIQFISITLFSFLFRLFIGILFQATVHPKKAIVVAPKDKQHELLKMFDELPDFAVHQGFDFQEILTLDVEKTMNGGVELVVFYTTSDMPEKAKEKILEFKVAGIQVMEMMGFIEEVFSKLPVRYLKKDWILLANGFSLLHRKVTQKIKRSLDIFFTLMGFLFSSPLWVMLPILIKLDSRGPVIYKQLRMGKNGKPFWLLKFRTMIDEAENGVAKWASEADPRITRVGRILRKLRIDELPQLINVVKGEMSLVGPRPERPDFVKELEKIIPFYALRHTVTPGLTGWAQVMYPYGASVDDAMEKLQYDLYYIKNMNLFLDFLIIVKTVRVVLTARGAR